MRNSHESKSDALLQLGETLKARRNALGLNQADIALKVGVTTSQYSKIERNKSIPDFIMMQKLATALGLKTHELVIQSYFKKKIHPDCLKDKTEPLKKLLDSVEKILFPSAETLDRQLRDEAGVVMQV